uniref:TadE family type IV pilus minor pilin n=1 Tax=Streptomyces polyasparticus TaxID=2767826 RepID=UPI00280BF0B4|nr:TadE family type IV pilus minor pilin [Streptomyces polyasparticus]
MSAEAACAMPALLLVGVALVWALMSAAAQIQCVDAARAGARAAARQESPTATVEAARQAAPAGAEIGVGREGDLVRVTVSATSPGPDVLALSLRASAVALAEETVGVGS